MSDEVPTPSQAPRPPADASFPRPQLTALRQHRPTSVLLHLLCISVLSHTGVLLLGMVFPIFTFHGFPLCFWAQGDPQYLPVTTSASELVSRAPSQLLGWPLHFRNFVLDGGFSDSVTPRSQLFQGNSLCALPSTPGLPGLHLMPSGGAGRICGRIMEQKPRRRMKRRKERRKEREGGREGEKDSNFEGFAMRNFSSVN